jgi:hypothetical protein
LCKHPYPTRELRSWKKCNGISCLYASQFRYFCPKTSFVLWTRHSRTPSAGPAMLMTKKQKGRMKKTCK